MRLFWVGTLARCGGADSQLMLAAKVKLIQLNKFLNCAGSQCRFRYDLEKLYNVHEFLHFSTTSLFLLFDSECGFGFLLHVQG